MDACDALLLLQEVSIAGKPATGARRGMKIRCVQKFAGREFQLPKRCASVGGYSCDLSTSYHEDFTWFGCESTWSWFYGTAIIFLWGICADSYESAICVFLLVKLP